MGIRAFATDTPRDPAAILTLSNARQLNDGCGGSRTRDDESRALVQGFPITPGVEYSTEIVGAQFMVYKRTSGGPQVKQTTTSDAARKVLEMNRAAKSLWSDNV